MLPLVAKLSYDVIQFNYLTFFRFGTKKYSTCQTCFSDRIISGKKVMLRVTLPLYRIIYTDESQYNETRDNKYSAKQNSFCNPWYRRYWVVTPAQLQSLMLRAVLVPLEGLVKGELSVSTNCTSVNVLAEISLRSSRKIFIFIIKKYAYRIKV